MTHPLARAYRTTGSHQWLGTAFVLALASAFSVTVPLPLSRSGTIELTAGDLLAVLLWVVLGLLLVTRRWKPSRTSVLLLVATSVFCAWFVVVTAIRLLRHEEVLQPFIVLRATLLPLAGYLLLDTRFENPRRVLQGLVVFELLLNIWHLNDWNDMRMSLFLGNSIVYAGLIVMLLPVNLQVAASSDPRAPQPLRYAAYANMLAALVFPVWTGSRGMTGVTFVVIVVCFVTMVGARKLVKPMLALAAVALVAHAALWYVNPQGAAYGIYRLVPPPAELGLPIVHSGQVSSDLAQRQTAVTETAKSDAGRFDLASESLSHIRKDPLIGDGTVYFDIPGDGTVQQYAAHNFVLEHINAYGGIGFLLYLGLFGVALSPVVRLLRRRGEPRRRAVLVTVMTAGLAAFSLTQPTSLIMVIMVPYFLAIAALLAHDRDEPERTG